MINIEKKKWTLMFFFASDNTLSPSMLSQIKAIKAAGYQQDTNVLLHFDPNERGAPTRVFEVNRNDRMLGVPSRIGDCERRLVSVMTGDDITSMVINELPKQVDEMEAKAALNTFLDFCRKSYPADHYMLFFVGHGMVVGRDAFLPDENPISAIKLAELGEILEKFCEEIKKQGGALELIGMHSCAMSGIEVAYQLQDTARYMMASQGVSFIGAWPYRQLLIKIFKTIEAERVNKVPVDVLQLAESLHDLCIQNSADFMIGGYSADLCLCTLSSTNVANLNEPIASLAEALKDGLQEKRSQELILLAHWKSQSYWQETYTDLYDFCLCLRRLCVQEEKNRPSHDARAKGIRKVMKEACESVIGKLKPKRPDSGDGPVIRTDFIGAGSQYSHGLSIYFPWSEPIQDKNEQALTNYEQYAFTTRLPKVAWYNFLVDYFRETRRPNPLDEDREFKDENIAHRDDPEFIQAVNNTQSAFKIPGEQGPQSVPSTALDGKVSPPDSGGACSCPSIKNYSQEFLMSFGASAVFMRRETKPATAS